MTKKPEVKHTPGPWQQGGFGTIYGPGITPNTGPQLETATCVCKVEPTNGHMRFVDSEQAKANARLIAAAPETAAERDRLKEINKELLDLAKEALNQLEEMDFSCSANWNGSLKTNVSLLLNAAIAKAEGRVS